MANIKSLLNLAKMRKIRGEIAPLFDAGFYLQSNPDVAESGMDPLVHYIEFGWQEGRDPSPVFSTSGYLAAYPELKAKGQCPLVHFARHGHEYPAAARKNAPVATAAPRLDMDSDIKRVLSVLGLPDKFQADIFNNRFLISFFDPKMHRGPNEEDLSDGELLLRYVIRDLDQGVSPGPLFDSDFYLSQLAGADLPQLAKGESAFRHWLKYGRKACIVPTPLFDEDDYLGLNRDLKAYPNWLFEHFVLHGMKEGRRAQRVLIVEKPRFEASEHADATLGLRHLALQIAQRPGAGAEIEKMQRFMKRDLHDIVAEAARIDPEAGLLTISAPVLMPPWHDRPYLEYAELRQMIPEGDYDFVVMMPFCKTGGSDYVSAVLANLLCEQGKVLILRTQEPEWAEPQWFSDQIVSVDLSAYLNMLDPASAVQMLFALLRRINPRAVFNINSRLTFDVFERFGARLRPQMGLFSYYFCADRTKDGAEAGYPVQKFANVLPFLDAALVDTQSLADTLGERYMLTPDLRARVVPIMTPAMSPVAQPPLVDAMLASAGSRRRPRIVWAGRFDRQKRFDFALQIAAAMPEIDFDFYGKAVLDAPPDLSRLPSNVSINGPFKSYDELDLNEADGWLYTSAWDGLPTILIELAAQGVPIVASAVGGVPELIDETTGWPVDDDAEVADYAARIREMLAQPDQRRARVQALQARVVQRHSRNAFSERLAGAMSLNATKPVGGSND